MSQEIVPAMLALLDQTISRITKDKEFGPIFDGTATREVYLKFLTRTYHYVSETIPQLRAGLEGTESRPDQVSKELADGFAHHIEEEQGHDRWLLADIKAIGGDPEAAKREDPGPAVRAYVAWSRFMCVHAPVGVKGFAFLLENISAALGVQAATSLKKQAQIPNIENAVLFLSAHGELDVGHREEARAQVEKITDGRDKEAILATAQVTAYLYQNLMAH